MALSKQNGVQIWQKLLEDGSYAIGLFNVGDYGKAPESYFRWGDEKAKPFTLDFNKINLKGKFQLRDVWRQKDLGNFKDSFKTNIRHHGVIMLKLSKQN